MKNIILFVMITLAIYDVSAEPLVFTGQTVTVDPQYLELESVCYTAATTNSPAVWDIKIRFELPRGYAYSLNNHAVTLDRFRCYIPIVATESDVQAVFGEAYPAIVFAASNGSFAPNGLIRDGFLSIGAAKLSGE